MTPSEIEAEIEVMGKNTVRGVHGFQVTGRDARALSRTNQNEAQKRQECETIQQLV